ncbi:DUF1232 domain-containing protein [Bacillus sp. JJ1127]|uniref:YkvA family protein n=1 Tax=Bacillus sp. JJ1127 TaxID=3122952 RepID=UPI002FFFDAD4
MKKFISRFRFMLHFRRFIPFLYDFFTSKEVPMQKKILSIGFLIGYVVFPFDLIPDFLFAFGVLDDVAVAIFILQRIVKMAPPHLQEKYDLNKG